MEISLPAWLEIRAHIGFICTFRFTPRSLVLSPSCPRALFPSYPLAGASQFYRHVPASRPTLSSTSRFADRRLTGGGKGGEGGGLASSGHHPRSPQFPTPRDGAKRVGTTRPVSSLGSSNGSSTDSQPLLAFLVSRFLPRRAHPLAPVLRTL